MNSGLFLCDRSISSIVGAVVIMEGAIPHATTVSFIVGDSKKSFARLSHYVLGRRFDVAIVDEEWAFEVVDSCGSDALPNLNKLNRRGLGDCSCTSRAPGLDDAPMAKDRRESAAFGKGS